MYDIKLQAPKLARKCEIKHWHACGTDGRKVGWSVYGHVIADFSSMDRFSNIDLARAKSEAPVNKFII